MRLVSISYDMLCRMTHTAIKQTVRWASKVYIVFAILLRAIFTML